jgi:hypothetical protein
MSDLLPAEVTVTDLPNGVRYRLPSRKWGQVALLGLGAVVGGLVGTAFLSFWVWAVGYHLPATAGLQAADGMLLLFMAFGLWMLLMAVRTAAGGLSRIFGHSEVELRDGTLRGLECWGPLRWGWRRPVAGLLRFDVRDAMQEERPGRVYEEARAATEYNVITAVWDAGADEKPRQLARGYPRDWLVPLARDLARRCQLAAQDDSTRPARAAPAIDVAEEPLPNQAGFVDLLKRPDDSRILVGRTGAGLTLTLPRKTFGRQHAVLTVTGDRLRVEQPKRFGDGYREWTCRQLATIRVGRIIDSEGPDTFQVQIEPFPGEGKRVRLTLTGEAEARWLATTLRRALGMPDDAAGMAAPFRERAEQPAGSKVIPEQLAQGVKLVVPPVGFRHPNVRYYGLLGLGYLAVALVGGGLLYAFLVLGGIEHDAKGFLHALWLVPALFGIGALGALGEVVKRARRHAVLAVVQDKLLVEQTNFYGTRHQEWRRSQVDDVRVGDTLEGRVSNVRARQAALDRTEPTWELHIHVAGGEVVRLLDGYDDADLQWLATVLRRALQLPAAPNPSRPGVPVP